MANKITYNVGFNVDNSQLNQLKQSLASLEKDFGLTDIQLIKKQSVEQAKADLQEVKNAAKLAGEALSASFNPKINAINIQAFQNYLNQSNMTVQQLGTSLSKAGLFGEQAFRNMSIQIMNTGFELKKTNSFIQSMGETLGNTIKWNIASSAINLVTGSVQKAWSYTKKLDASLNDIRIVTGKSAESMEKFAKQANKAAKSLGAATTDYTNASLIYYQQGLGEDDVTSRTEATVKAANVIGQSTAEVSEQLTAVWNGYKVVAQEAELYVDKLAAVAAGTAADLEELSDGMSKVASAANTMGVDIDQLSAQLATIVSVTRQDASSIGTALKTIYARMGDLKVDGVDEFGTSLGDVSGQMRQMGIEVLDQQGNLRDMGAVIEEVAAKWGTWTDAQQQAAAIAMAGKRQYNNLIALFENWDMYESALTMSQTSAGTLQKQQDIYMDSIEAHLQQLATAGEKVYDTFFDSDSMRDLIDVLTVVVERFADFTNAIGGGGNLLLAFGSIAMRVFSNQIGNAITGFISNIQAARFNVNQLQAQIALLDQLGDAQMPKTQAAYHSLLEMKKEELRYHKAITAEQRQQADAIIEQTNNLEAKKENQTEALNQYQIILKSLTGKDVEIVGMRAEHLETNEVAEETYRKVQSAELGRQQLAVELENKGLSTTSINNLKMGDANNWSATYQEATQEIEQKITDLKQKQNVLLEDNIAAGELSFSEEGDSDIDIAEMQTVAEDIAAQYDILESQVTVLEELLKKINNVFNENLSAITEMETLREGNEKEILTEGQALTKLQEWVGQIRDKNFTVSSALTDLDTYRLNQNNLDIAQQETEKAKAAVQSGLGIEDIDNISKEQQAIFTDEQNQLLEEYKRKTEELATVQEKVKNSSDAQKQAINDLNSITSDSSKILTEDQKVELLSIQTNEKYVNVLNKVAKGERLTAQEQKILQKYFSKSKKVLDEASQGAEKTTKEFVNLGNAARTTAAQADVAKEAWNKMSKQMQIQAVTTQLVDMVGVIGQISSALSGLSNLGDIWNDETLSGGEKFLQTLTALGTMIPMLVSGIGALKNGYLGIGAALLGNNSALAANMLFLKAKTEEDKKAALIQFLQAQGIELSEEALKKKSVADLMAMATQKGLKTAVLDTIPALISQGIAAWFSLGPYALIIGVAIAAIAALIVGIVGLTAAFKANGDNGEKAFNKASEAAEGATEEFNRVKAAYEELKESFEDYNNAQKAIEEMTVGTEEWRQAIQDANMQVIDLMNKYPELAKYVDNVDGQLKISAAGQEAMLAAEEERVNIASRAQMAGQTNKLNAKNNMDIKQGANKTLNTDAYQNAGAVMGIGLTVIAGPLGAVAGGLGATPFYLEAENREDAYEKAIEMAAEDNTILASEEAFAKAMADAGFSEYTEALWAERDALMQNSATLKANNAAIKIQQEEIARSYLTETKKFENLEEEDQDTLAKIVAKETGTDSDKYKEAINQLGGEDISDKEAKAFADQYAKQMGIDAVKTEVEDGVITYTDSSGEEIKVKATTAQTALAQEIAGSQVTDSYVQGKIKLLEQLEAAANSTGASFGNLVTKFAVGDSADLTSGTSKQIKELQGAVNAYNEAYENATDGDDKGSGVDIQEREAAGGEAFAQAMGYANEDDFKDAVEKMGYDSIEEYKDAIQESIDNYNKEKRKLTLGLDASVTQELNSLKTNLKNADKDFEDFSLQTQKVIVSGMETAFEKGGSEGLNAFSTMIAEGNFNESEIQKISDAIAEVDWTSSGAVNDLAVALEAAGIEIDENSVYWNKMVDAMEASTNVVQDVVNKLDTLRSTLASIAELTDDLHLGDIISDEDYDTLIANNEELKKYFVMTADGYKYLGGAEAEIEKAKNNVLDVDEIKENFDKAKASGSSLLTQGKDSGFFTVDEKTGKVSVKASQQDALTAEISSGKYNALLDASGYNSEQYISKAKELKATSSLVKTKEGSLISLADIKSATNATDLASKLGFTEYTDENGNTVGAIQEYANTYFGGDFDAANEALVNAMSDASTRISDAETYIKNAETAVLNSLNQIQSGDWDQLSRDAQTSAISGLAKTYDELQEYKEKLYEEDYEKLATVYLAEEAEQLDINASAWESYVKSVNENFDEQDNMLKVFQELQLYEQADTYYYLNRAIEEVTSAIDALADAQNRLYGTDILDNLDAQIEKYKELYEKQQAVFKEQKEQETLSRKALNFYNAKLKDYEVGNITYNEDGTVSEASYNAIYAAALQASQEGDSEGFDTLVGILDSIVTYNDSVLDRIQSEEDALTERNNNILDAQIEKYNQEIEMNREFHNTTKEWRNSIRDFKRFSAEGIAAFEELSAGQTLTNIMDKLNDQGMGATNPASFNEISQLESWANGGGVDNPFVGEDGTFDENAFNEAYTSAMETAQEDVQELIDLGQELFDTWLDALEEISAIYDEQAEKLSTINSLLESSANLNQLFGNKSSQYFIQMRRNAEQTVEIYAAQAEQLEKQYNEFFDGNGQLIEGVSQEQADAVWDAYTAAKQNHVDAIQAQYDAITAEFEASMQEIVNDLFGGSMSNFSELWNLQKSADEIYFDDVNAEYEKYKFERAVQSSIDATDSITAQNKLKNVLSEQLEILERKGKLSQYDLDRANAIYDLTLKQIALEEAQQTANKMKLTRDAMGNYTYQYVADEDTIAQAEEELAAAENDLYNLQKDHQSELIDSMISGVQEYQELTVKYMNDPEMLAKIQDHYSTFFGNLKGDMEELGMDISGLTEMFGSDMSTPWMDTFDTLAEVDIVGLLESTANLFSGENGIIAALQSTQDNFNDYLEVEEKANARLTGYTKDVEGLNIKATVLATKMDDANTAITTLVRNLDVLATNLDAYAQKYTRYLAAATGNPLDTGEEKAPDEEMADSTGDTNDATNEELLVSAKQSTELGKEMVTALWTVNDTLVKLPATGGIHFMDPVVDIPIPVPAPGNYFTQNIGIGVNNRGVSTGANFGNSLIIK